MINYLLREKSDIQRIRNLLSNLPQPTTVVDFEETMLLSSVKATTRLWQENEKVIAFAFVDDYNNLRFEIDPDFRSAHLEKEIIEWGIACVKKRNNLTGSQATLDTSFKADHKWQINMLERYGFERADVRTLHYARPMSNIIKSYTLPAGFTIRSVAGQQEVKELVSLHRAAFGTKNMTIDQRLAIMNAPDYEQELDLLAISPTNEMVAFCICTLETGDDGELIGYTDPIGTHPQFQQQGISKALVTTGIQYLKKRGATTVKLSTSSTNMPMQHLAQSLGFTCESEKLWFSKKVT